MLRSCFFPCAALLPVDDSFPHRIGCGQITSIALPATSVLNPARELSEHLPATEITAGSYLALTEPWRLASWHERHDPVLEYGDGTFRAVTPEKPEIADFEEWLEDVVEQASSICARASVETDQNGAFFWPTGQSPLPWNPASTLPRWGSRQIVEVLSVKRAKLHDLSDDLLAAFGVHAQSRIGDDPAHPVWTVTGDDWREDYPLAALDAYLHETFPECWGNEDSSSDLVLLTVRPV